MGTHPTVKSSFDVTTSLGDHPPISTLSVRKYKAMAAYLIGQIIIHDMEKFLAYVADTSAVIAKYGGEVLDVVEAKEVMEGDWPVGARTALVRFPDEASLRRFWNSPENAPMKELRHGTATSHVAMCISVPGDNPPK